MGKNNKRDSMLFDELLNQELPILQASHNDALLKSSALLTLVSNDTSHNLKRQIGGSEEIIRAEYVSLSSGDSRKKERMLEESVQGKAKIVEELVDSKINDKIIPEPNKGKTNGNHQVKKPVIETKKQHLEPTQESKTNHQHLPNENQKNPKETNMKSKSKKLQTMKSTSHDDSRNGEKSPDSRRNNKDQEKKLKRSKLRLTGLEKESVNRESISSQSSKNLKKKEKSNNSRAKHDENSQLSIPSANESQQDDSDLKMHLKRKRRHRVCIEDELSSDSSITSQSRALDDK